MRLNYPGGAYRIERERGEVPAVATISSVSPGASPRPVPARADFADVSHWQGDHLDWDSYDAAGAQVAICQVSKGKDSIDATMPKNRESLSRLGLACGLYHFAGSRTTITDPATEADLYLRQVGTLGPKEFPVLDFELPYGMTPVDQTKWVVDWCERVEQKTGKTPWLYTNSWMLSQLDTGQLTRYPLWLANYHHADDKAHPPESGPLRLAAWQFTDKASFAGLGQCDGSFLYSPPG